MTTKVPFKIAFASLLMLSIFIVGFKIISFKEPKVSLEGYQIEDGFELSVIASESLLKAPVSMDFDNKGRMWVVEMIGYMPNLEGIGEDEPNGKIIILEDLDKNGVIDHSKTFLDKLVLPRGLAHVYGGLLYVDGPKLWFVEIKNDKPGKKTLVDPVYAEGGNVEHSSNGLMMNIDNWIYNSNYNFRYQLKNGKWIKEPTSYRGQWGITKDNFGRLYYNNNSVQLQGDYVLPNKVIRNKYFKPSISEGQKLTNNKVFPIHQTSVNRGYQKGVLDERGFLTEVTASCGPLIYRGGAFPNAYDQNAFVCVPEANLIKRNILNFDNTQTLANQAIAGKEFIASTDEGFRPVNLFNGPDGAMYIVDMHRGIIQHKAYISQYLTEQLANKKLDTLQNAGRILKVVNKTSKLNSIPDLTKATNKELLALLSSPNGWLRDRCQQILIQKKDLTISKDLITLAKSNNEFSKAIHALYVLEGLNALPFSVLSDVIEQSKQPETIAHALGLLERFATPQLQSKMMAISTKLLAQNNEAIDLYLAFSLNNWLKSSDAFLPILAQIEKKYADKKVFQEAIVSSLDGKEEQYLNTQNPSALLKNNLTLAITNHQKKELNPIFVKEKNVVDNRTKGLQLFRSICATCHGADGKGIQDLAPPLKGSEYVDGSMKRLASIILHGLSGPINVNGKLYQLNNEMPGLINNKDVSDEDIADVIRFIQNAFAKEGKGISASEIKKLRDKKPIGGLFNEKQLLETDFEK
ncbi:PVC-type heme-binding CxxCH protein [Emticicia sp. SJ17W-69]|uniref:PVC-type heme-binding CxxCH protein n=1 Tax=Emticicia sp. SJ17W-69 TaxID=3421657 RepID=UPI003EBC36B4